MGATAASPERTPPAWGEESAASVAAEAGEGSVLGTRTGRASWVPQAVAVLVAALAFLPIVNWIPNGYEFPEYGSKLVEWAWGSAIAIGAGIVLAILSRRLGWIWNDEGVERLARLTDRRPWFAVAAVAGVGGCFYIAVAHWIFHGRPLLIDEIVEVRQAQIFAGGRLWLSAPRHPEFFSSLHMVDAGGRVYSQFPPGGPALLALGALAGATWLAVPVCAVLSVIAFAAFVRVAEPNGRVRTAAVALFAIAPFTVFMSGSHMNHVTALTCTLIGAAALVHASADGSLVDGRPGLAFLSGIGFGAAATIRPVDALAFAAPAACWYVTRAVRNPRRWIDAFAALAGVAIPMGIMFYVNAHTTGAPLLFGYQVMWGKDHDLGFHPAPWGQPHTPARGLELINLYFLRLQDYLFETPIPALVPAIGSLALTKRLRPADRYLLASSGVVVALYFAYWADGNFLGPRFMYSLLPVAALWTARFPGLLRGWLRQSALTPTAAAFAYRAAVLALVVSAAMALVEGIPLRAQQYRNNFATERWATPQVAAQSGVHDALVFVREGWEEQLVARMWALGVSHAHVETLYRGADVCRLDSGVAALERPKSSGGKPIADPFSQLAPLLRDSALVETQTVGPGAKLHMQHGYAYSAHCLRRAQETADGISPLAPLLAVGGGSDRNVYARDLHARDSVLLAAYPDRPIYLLRPTSAAPGALPAFFPVSRDSLQAAWRVEERE